MGEGLRLERRYLFVAVLVAAAVCLYAAVHANPLLLRAALEPGPVSAEFRVTEADVWGDPGARRGSAKGRVEDCRVEARFDLPEGAVAPRVGETWRFTGYFGRDRGYTRRLWVKGRGTDMTRLGSAPFGGLERRLERLRRDLSRRAGLGIDRRWADLSRAILLGERRRMDGDALDVFRTAGTMHLFAISGLHVMVIAGFLVFLLQLAGLDRRLVYLLVIPILWAYVVMIGRPPSAVRAALMASFYFAAPVFYRRSNALVSWSLALLAVALFAPFTVNEVGSLLSFTVMLGILLAGRWLRNFPSRRWDYLVCSFAAWAAGMPIAARVFGRVTPGGILANLVLLPVAAIDVVLGVTGLLLSFVSDTLAGLVNGAAALLIQFMFGVSWCIAHIPGASYELEKPSWWMILAWYVALLFLAWSVKCLYHRFRPLL